MKEGEKVPVKATVWPAEERSWSLTVRSLGLYSILLLALALILAAIFADRLCPYDPNAQDLTASLQAPNLRHLMGTDLFGRDMFSRVITGGRVSILSALAVVGTVVCTGTLLGVVCGYAGGALDAAILRVADVFLAFPGLVLALGIAALLHGGLAGAILSLVLTGWPKYCRLARAETLKVRESTYVEAAVAIGEGPAGIIRRHILPNIAGPILVTAALDIGTAIMELAGLSFLGLGAKPPTAEWGSMMSSGRSLLFTSPWVVLAPGVGMLLTVAVFNLLGEALRVALAPEQNFTDAR